MEKIKNLQGCCTNIENLIALEKRAAEDLENNTHSIGQEEVLTIIREFIRCKNHYLQLENRYKNTGKLVKNKRNGKIGVILREFEAGQIQVLEKIQPKVINTHDNWKILELLDT